MRKQITKTKHPITIREKELKDGRKSLYFDIYRNGERQKEYLGYYLLPEVGALKAQVKEHNRQTLEAVEALRALRYREILNDETGIKRGQSKILLSDWIDEYVRKLTTTERKASKRIINALCKLLEDYTGGKSVMLKDVDKAFCIDFIHYLKVVKSERTSKPLTLSTIRCYLIQFSAMLNQAVKDELIYRNWLRDVTEERPKRQESKVVYLTEDEVKKMSQTPCNRPKVKNAFLFSCFCGLRISDIETLTWGHIIRDGDKYRIEKRMVKTNEPIYLPLNNTALSYLPQREAKTDNDKVFELPTRTTIMNIINKWAKDSGIIKKVTFHVSRHTCATLLISKGGDLYTIKELLGHKDIRITETYAKIINEKKIDAMNLLDDEV